MLFHCPRCGDVLDLPESALPFRGSCLACSATIDLDTQNAVDAENPPRAEDPAPALDPPPRTRTSAATIVASILILGVFALGVVSSITGKGRRPRRAPLSVPPFRPPDLRPIQTLWTPTPRTTLFAGAASRDITPAVETWEDTNGNGRYDRGEPFRDLNGNGRFDAVWLAGFKPGRSATGVHDPLTAQALVLRSGKTEVALVAVDLVGLSFGNVTEIRRAAEKRTRIPAAHIVVASTHNHSGPDTIGLWGPLPGLSGRDETYLRRMRASVVEAIEEARRRLVPVRIRYAEEEIKGLVGDSREPKVMNEIGRAILFEAFDGKARASLVNFSCHPEARGSANREITSDYPHYVRREMTRRTGAPCLFTVGDIGGLIAPRVGRRWEDCERMGVTIARRLEAALRRARVESPSSLKTASRPLEFPLQNRLFRMAARAKLFGDATGFLFEKDGAPFLRSEMTAIRLGDIVLVTVPGEIFPELARRIYAAIEAPRKIMIGLGNDEIGYIIPEDAWDPRKYEESMSLGRRTGTLLVEAALRLLRGF